MVSDQPERERDEIRDEIRDGSDINEPVNVKDRQGGVAVQDRSQRAVDEPVSSKERPQPAKAGQGESALKSCEGFLDEIRNLRTQVNAGVTKETRPQFERHLKSISTGCEEAKRTLRNDATDRKEFDAVKAEFDVIAKDIGTKLKS